jgi:hypothetical protein
VGQEAIKAIFNRNTSVIPAGILGVGETLDGAATTSGKVLSERVARCKTSLKDITMTSAVTLILNSTGTLAITSANFQDLFRPGATKVGKTSLYRQLCTNAILDAVIPEYYGASPSQFNAPAAGLYQPKITGSAEVYGFDQDASRAEQVGGFGINLSSLTAYVDNCSGLIPTFINC